MNQFIPQFSFFFPNFKPTMEPDFAYHAQRMQLLFETMKWLVDAQQIGVSLPDLAKRLELNEWEVQHLFQEYIAKDPIAFVKAVFSPALAHATQPSQLSIFDAELEDSSPNEKGGLDVDIQLLDQEPTSIHYAVFPYFLGEVMIAASEFGICQITFEDSDAGLVRLRKTFRSAELIEESTDLLILTYLSLMDCFSQKEDHPVIPVAVKATPFQLSVWIELITTPKGKLTTYGEIAQKLGDPNASRAVGTAVGANPIAILIPCHRVVNQTGKIGHFRWGTWRKQLLLAIER